MSEKKIETFVIGEKVAYIGFLYATRTLDYGTIKRDTKTLWVVESTNSGGPFEVRFRKESLMTPMSSGFNAASYELRKLNDPKVAIYARHLKIQRLAKNARDKSSKNLSKFLGSNTPQFHLLADGVDELVKDLVELRNLIQKKD